MKSISLLIKPASSLCNLRCKYCFYTDEAEMRNTASYGIMQEATVSAMLHNIALEFQHGDNINFAFQGGEPTLAGLEFFVCFVEKARAECAGRHLSFALQTNGILLDDAWCAFLTDKHFLVGLSIDGPSDIHDANRVDADGRGTYKRLMATMQLLNKHGTQYNILSVLTQYSARYAQKVWAFILRNKVQYIQFIPCLGLLGGECASPCALSPDRFASFYTELFRLWLRELENGHYISVKFFDDLINLLHSGKVNACGFTGKCQPQFVIEADGGVYPCDFYVLDEWRMGNIADDSPSALLSSEAQTRFLSRERAHFTLCDCCAYAKLCNGGCARMQSNMYVSADGKFCGYQRFLDDNEAAILRAIALCRK